MAKKPLTPKWKKKPKPSHYVAHPAVAADDVNSVAISADGSKVIAGTFFFNNGQVPVTKTVGLFAWDASGHQVWDDPFPATAAGNETAGVYAVSISRDGSWAASGGTISPGVGFIHAVDATSGSKWLIYSPPARTNSVAINQDGSYLVAGADCLYAFARTGPTVWASPQTISFPGGNVASVAISGDGQWIVAGIYGGYVALIHNATGVLGPATTFKIPNGGWVLGIAIAADGSGFVVGSSDGSLYFFDIPAFQTSGTFAWKVALAGASACRSVAVSDDASLVCAVASAGSGARKPSGTGIVYLFRNNGSSGTQQWTGVTDHGPNSTSMDSNGKFVTAADGSPPPGAPGGEFCLFDGTNVWKHKTTDMDYTMQISANANGIVGGSDDGKVYYFSVP